jgi:alpha-glucoside transport system substrate-binding protein
MTTRPMSRARMTTLVFALLALFAAACGGGDGGETTEDSSAGDGDGAVSGELSVLITWTGSEQEAFQGVIDGFTEANPDVSVDLVQVPFGELNTQLTQQYASGNAPDVHVALPGLLRLLSQQQFLMPLDDRWDQWVDDGWYTDALRQIASVDGTSYGAWFKGNVNAEIWYRPDTLSELGIEVPTTWDDFLAALEAADADGGQAIAVGGADQWPLTQWSDAILARVAGPEAFNGLIDGSVNWDDPRVVEAFEVFGQLIEDHFPDNALDLNFGEATCLWVDGRAAFQNQGAFVNLVAPAECDDSLEPGRDYTFFEMPGFDDPEPAARFISGDLFAVNADTDNPDAAMALVDWLASADGQTIWAERGGFVAPNAEVDPSVYPDDNDRKSAELWPASPDDPPAVYDLDDAIGGEIQSTERTALADFVRDTDVDAFIQRMVTVTDEVRGQ